MKNILISIILIFTIVNTNAQSLRKLINSNTKNYNSIVKEIENNKSLIKNASPKELKMYNRWQWFWNTRVDSSGSFNKYYNAMSSCFNKIYPDGKVNPALTLKSASSLNWTCLGPSSRPSGSDDAIGRGRIRCIWVDPADYDHILIGANSGGLWVTHDKGTHWNCLTNTTMTGGVSDIAVHPTNTNIIYIATAMHINGGVGSSKGYTLGIFKTTNGGSSWTKLSLTIPQGDVLEGLLIHPTAPSLIYAMSNRKVYISFNSGSTWEATSLSLPASTNTNPVGLKDILFKPNNPNTIYVSGYNAIYKTTNAGGTWTDLSGNMAGLFSNSRIAIATNPTDNDDLYAFFCEVSGSGNGIQKSINGGDSWSSSPINSDYQTGVHYALNIKLSPNGDIYTGGRLAKRSINGGNSFNYITSNYIHDDIMEYIFPDPNNNNLVYVVCDGGVYMDTNGGTSWDRINGDLATNEFYDIGIIQGNPNKVIGGAHDSGSYKRDNNGNWSFIYGGDGGTSLFDQSDNGIFYITANSQLRRNGSGLFMMEVYDSPVVMDPNNSNILYAGDRSGPDPNARFKKSINKGTTWTTLDKTWFDLKDISICEANTNYIYYSTFSKNTYSSGPGHGDASKIRRTTDGGTNWSHANYSNFGGLLKIAPINAIYVHPYNPKKVWVVFGGFEQSKKVFYSEDGGDSWDNITGSGLPNLPIQCFEYDFLNQTMFVGTDAGLYYREMDGNSWAYAGNLPRIIVSDIELNKLTGELVIATYGRGIWKTDLGTLGYCYNSSPLNINLNTNWSTNNEVCNDVNINSGKLKITANITMSYKSTISVKNGATLEIDGGLIKNGKIVVENGGDLIIKNNGKIKLNNSSLEVKSGGEMTYSKGEIDITQ